MWYNLFLHSIFFECNKRVFMTASTAPKKDDAPVALPAAVVADANKKEEAYKTPAVSNDKK